MSRAAPARESRRGSARGPAWDRLSLEICIRDGAYRDGDGRLHKVCRNWLEAKRLGLSMGVLPQGCVAHNGEDEVWACHGQGWSTHPALRLVSENVLALCQHCDPDRNPAVRPGWWGNPKHPVKAGWERASGDPWELWGFGLLALSVVLGVIGFQARTPLVHIWLPYVAGVLLLVSAPMWWVKHRHGLSVLVSSLPLWGLAVTGNALARTWPSLRPWTLGLPTGPRNFLDAAVVLLALWGACLILCHVALRRRWLSSAGRGIWHALVRLARWAKP